MTAWRGVVSAGTFCVDLNKSIERWPSDDTSARVLAIERKGGGSAYNVATDLKRLDPAFPVEAMGVVGDDDLGRALFAELDARGIAREGLLALSGATMTVDAFNVGKTGRRTHFFHEGAAAEMNPDHFVFWKTSMRRLHLGLPGAHEAMDRPWGEEANGWAAVLRKARGAGLKTNLNLLTTNPTRIAELGRPCLPYLDTLIVNEFEIGALTGHETHHPDGSTDINGVRAALGEALALGAMEWAIAHFPEGAVASARDGTRILLGSVAMPPDVITGANGAGDAFATGILYGLERDWPIGKCLHLAHSVAAASMREASTTEGVGTLPECFAWADKFGFRPLPG